MLTRREAVASIVASVAVLAPRALVRPARAAPPRPLFTISLAQWSLHRALGSGSLDHLDFPGLARSRFAIDAVEYVNSFFKSAEASYVAELRRRADDAGVVSVLIMCDGEGALGDPDEAKRAAAVENHRKWLEAAKALGCHSIRVNAHSRGSADEQRRLAADGLRRLCERAEPLGLNVIVENHGGLSSNGAWLASTIRAADHPRAGTLPDFGNFRVDGATVYDRYRGTAELMPFARGVSAKSYDFRADGEEVSLDYRRLLGIVVAAGYHGRIGIEYEGGRLSEFEGIRATQRLLERIREEMTLAGAGS
ncbi:MAG: sugar phosphate isomerase/epimerase [Phycisphaerae bacterium]|nr:sugar phosphate isomerase/epimerase [Phycisphaerae bacterium]